MGAREACHAHPEEQVVAVGEGGESTQGCPAHRSRPHNGASRRDAPANVHQQKLGVSDEECPSEFTGAVYPPPMPLANG